MNFIIIGCGRIGADLAFRLFKKGHHVTVIDNVPQAFERLNPEYRDRTVEGEALSKEVLERAGIGEADGLAAVTNSDALNAAVAHIARSIYKIPNVIVRNYDPRMRSVHEAFNLQIVSSTSWGAQRTEELLSDISARAVFSPGNGEVEVYELTVPQRWNNVKLTDLLCGTDYCLPVALTRSGTSMLPTMETTVQTSDVITVSATAEGIACLRNLLLRKE